MPIYKLLNFFQIIACFINNNIENILNFFKVVAVVPRIERQSLEDGVGPGV